jgi:hypothetical protein
MGRMGIILFASGLCCLGVPGPSAQAQYPMLDRIAFIDRVAAPIWNRLFECELIPCGRPALGGWSSASRD